MKKLIAYLTLAVGAMCLSVSASADESIMRINLANGYEPVEYGRSDGVSVKFANGGVQVRATNGGFSALTEEVRSIKFSVPSGIAQAKIEEGRVTLRRVDNLLYVEGLSADHDPGVEIFSITGQTMYVDAAWHGTPIDISRLGRGVYLLRVDGKSYKFVK